MTTLPLSSILVEDRQRLDLGDIDSLADSLKEYGLIQPIVITKDNRLIAGGRRLAAATKLGWTDIPIVYKETLDEAHLTMLELEENIRRKDMTWMERCITIAKVHRLHRSTARQEGEEWGQRETGSLLGVSLGAVNNAIDMASRLRREPKDQELWSCATMKEAMELLWKREEADAVKVLAERQRALANVNTEEATNNEFVKAVEEVAQKPELLAEERKRYKANPLNTMPFEEYWEKKMQMVEDVRNTIYLSNRLIHSDCLNFMRNNVEAFDHIITDPPYGIDMDNLGQQNMGMVDIDLVEREHDVVENKKLLNGFIAAAYRSLKENGFLVMWCDYDLWSELQNAATLVGFKVQRWPLTWCKSYPCQNGAAQYNFTKSTEIAMVCRKGKAMLTRQQPTCHIIAGRANDFDHPFAKPAEVWNFILNAISIKGQHIYEPFAGVGSGVVPMIAAERTVTATEINERHHYELIENVKKYYLNLNPRSVFK